MASSYPWSGTPSSTHTPYPTLSLICLLVLVYWHHTSSLAFVSLVNSACLHSLSFVTHFSQSQTHTQLCNIICHLCTHSQSRNIIGHLCTHSSSHNTIGQCLLYNLSHTAVSLVLYAVDKGLHGRNVLQSLLLILLCIFSRSVCPIQIWSSSVRRSVLTIEILLSVSSVMSQALPLMDPARIRHHRHCE